MEEYDRDGGRKKRRFSVWALSERLLPSQIPIAGQLPRFATFFSYTSSNPTTSRSTCPLPLSSLPLPLLPLTHPQHPNLPLQSIPDLRKLWDWSLVKVHLIASLHGKHEGWPAVLQVGHPRLMKAVRNMGLAVDRESGKEVEVECQVSEERVILSGDR